MMSLWRALSGCLAAAGALLLASCASPPSTDELFRASTVTYGERAALIRSVPDVPRQGGAAEGAAALVDVAVFWQKQLSYSNGVVMLRKARAKASAEDALLACGDSLGLWSFSLRGTPEAIVAKLRHGIPVVVILQDWTSVDSRRFSVVAGFDDVGKRFLCHDGSTEPAVYSYDEFGRKWLPASNWMGVMCPPEAARWPLSVQDLLSRAQFYEARSQLQQARQDLERASGMEPANDGIKQSMAAVLQAQGEFERAAVLFRGLYEKNPEDARAANNLAFVLAKSRTSLEEAERIARSVVRREPSNPAALDTLGYVLTLRENFTEAIPLLEKAYDRAQVLDAVAQREIAVHLALAYMGDRRERMLKKIVDDILAENPGFVLPEEIKKFMKVQ